MLRSKINMLQNVTMRLRLEHILWDDLSNRKELEIIMSGNLNSSGSLNIGARESEKYRLDS
jgi:hypothetical protein